MNHHELLSYVKEQVESLEIFKVISGDVGYIREAANTFAGCEKILVFGTGGSSLGGKCLVNFEAMYSGIAPRVQFVENPDARCFANTIRSCDQSKTGIIVISKSGKTTETLAMFMTLLEMWPDFNYRERSLAITEPSNKNDLRELAESIGMSVIDHDPSIGGRFSVFSMTGLLPALLGGVDIDEFRKGAIDVVDEILKSNSIGGCRTLLDIVQIGAILNEQRVRQHVLISYSDLMRDFGEWFEQLVAESLGKAENFGVTPIPAIGTVDQHSLLQLLIGGPSDKLFTVVVQKNGVQTPKITTNTNSDIISRLVGHNVHDLMVCHQLSTIDVLREKGHVRVIEFDEINIRSLGTMMALMFVEVITIAKIAGVNPFDQPAVERSKRLAMYYLETIHT
jgi:glucose-6-phosphate isomerase